MSKCKRSGDSDCSASKKSKCAAATSKLRFDATDKLLAETEHSSWCAACHGQVSNNEALFANCHGSQRLFHDYEEEAVDEEKEKEKEDEGRKDGATTMTERRKC